MSKQPTLALIKSLISLVKDYGHNRLELLKLKAVDKTAKFFSALVSSILLFVIFFTFILVFNIGLALWIGDLVGKPYIGFLLVSLLYVIAGLVIFLLRKTWLKPLIASIIIRKIL